MLITFLREMGGRRGGIAIKIKSDTVGLEISSAGDGVWQNRKFTRA